MLSGRSDDSDGEEAPAPAPQVDRLWIIDVDGQRLVVDASYGPSATAAERDALGAMVESFELV